MSLDWLNNEARWKVDEAITTPWKLLFVVKQCMDICDEIGESYRARSVIDRGLHRALILVKSFEDAYKIAELGKRYHENDEVGAFNHDARFMNVALKKAIQLATSHQEAVKVHSFAEPIHFSGNGEVCRYALSKAAYLRNEEAVLNSPAFKNFLKQ
ncbi:MAG: hypothetical protein C4534_09315 [Gaiellales bacterium]|nr:MAG: hypothetical protein C4534_09315 [Gaiellales bacterium]